MRSSTTTRTTTTPKPTTTSRRTTMSWRTTSTPSPEPAFPPIHTFATSWQPQVTDIIQRIIHLDQTDGVRLFARRTFTTPKIRTFTTPKFGHFPPPKKNICQEDNCPPQFFFLFWRTFLGFFDLQLMEDVKDGKEEVLDEVVMEHIKKKVRDEVVMEHIK